jgi:hypothetical protein
MDRSATLLVLLMLAWAPVYAEDVAEEAVEEAAAEESEETSEPTGNGITSPKKMSGMSILGNEETPKSLVIVPWKSSEMGDAISLSDTLDDRATPVDKEVFLRQLRYYEIRSGEPQD